MNGLFFILQNIFAFHTIQSLNHNKISNLLLMKDA